MIPITSSTTRKQIDHSEKDARSSRFPLSQASEIMDPSRQHPFYRHENRPATTAATKTTAATATATTTADRPNSTPAYTNPSIRYNDDINHGNYGNDDNDDNDDNGDNGDNDDDDDDIVKSDDNDYNHGGPFIGRAQDSFDTVLSFLRKNDELAQQIDTIEQLESISFLRVMYMGVTSTEEKRLFLKKLSDGLSETLFRQTLITPPPPPPPPPSPPMQQGTFSKSPTPSQPPPPAATTRKRTVSIPEAHGFRERKHHLLPLHLFLADAIENEDHAATFEDNGVAIVEADFSVDTNSHHQRHRHDPDLVLHYIYTQCQRSYSPSIINPIINPPPQWAGQHFSGHVFPEGTPNGIDLCVYFYHDAQTASQVSEEMELLWKINALHIPVLPILSMSNQRPPTSLSALSPSPSLAPSTATATMATDGVSFMETEVPNMPLHIYSNHAGTDDHCQDRDDYYDLDGDEEIEQNNNDSDVDDDGEHRNALYLKQRSIETRRNELAHIFSQWKIKMMDISNLDIIGQPSFQQKGKSCRVSSQEDRMIEQRLGQTWARSSMVSPTPYHILTILQFIAIDRCAVSKLLKSINDQAEARRNNGVNDDNDNNIGSNQVVKNEPVTPLSTSTSSSTVSTESEQNVSPPFVNSDSFSKSYHQLDHTTRQRAHRHHHQQQIQTHSQQEEEEEQRIQQRQQRQQRQKSGSVTPRIHILYVTLVLIVGLYIVWLTVVATTSSILAFITQSPPWHASLVLVSHQNGKGMTLMLNVYDGYDQPKWAPVPPLLETNLPLELSSSFVDNSVASPSSSSSASSSSSSTSSSSIMAVSSAGLTTLAPLPNKTQSVDGQYLFSILLPACSSLDATVTYTVEVKSPPSSSLANTIQVNPFQIPTHILCDGTSNEATMTDEGLEYTENHMKEAWNHFKQHSRFYLMNSVKIVEMIFTEGKEK